MTDQPEALRLADALGSHYAHLTEVPRINREAAAELRRLHKMNQELLDTLKQIAATKDFAKNLRLNGAPLPPAWFGWPVLPSPK
jgi:hypothetical protein